MTISNSEAVSIASKHGLSAADALALTQLAEDRDDAERIVELLTDLAGFIDMPKEKP